MATDTTATTTRTKRTRRRLRRKRVDGWPSRDTVLGVALGLVLLLGVLSFGGVHPSTRAVLHVLLAGCTGIALWQHDRVLARAGRVGSLGGLVVGALAVVAVGLVPLPGGLLAWLSPGTAAAAPGRLHTLSWSVPDTIDTLTLIGLGGGAALVTGIWSASRPRHRTLEVVAAIGTAVVAATAMLHAGFGVTRLFGLVDTWVTPPDRFFAPFLNDNHLASVLLLTWPLWIDVALDPVRPVRDRAVAVALALVEAALLVASGSIGGSVVALAIAGAVAVARGVVPLAAGGGAAGLSLVGLGLFDPLSEHGRTSMWAATLRLWWDHPWFGSGAGTFGRAIEPYRTDLDFVTWHHAHADWLQWGAETGLLGAVALGLGVVWLVRQPASREPLRDRWLALGALGVALHALVEFPLHVPGILMAAAAVFAVHQVALRDPEEASPRRLRRWLGVAIGVQLAMAAWQVRAGVEREALAGVLEPTPAASRAVARLAVVAPWRPEIALARALELERAGRRPEAAELARRIVADHPADVSAQRLAAGVLARCGALDDARSAIERVVRRSPSDWRGWAERAVVVEQHAPSERADAWREAIRRGAPARYLRRAWTALPVGLAWVDAVAAGPPRLSRAVAHVLVPLDPEAARIGFEQARRGDHFVDPGHVRLLMTLGDLAEAERLLHRARARRPDDRRYLRLEAELRDRQERHAEAARAWLVLAREDPATQLFALRAVRRAEGIDAALSLAGMLRLERGSESLHPAARLEHARLLYEADRPDACSERIRRSGLLADHRFAAAARQTLERCRVKSREGRPMADR